MPSDCHKYVAPIGRRVGIFVEHKSPNQSEARRVAIFVEHKSPSQSEARRVAMFVEPAKPRQSEARRVAMFVEPAKPRQSEARRVAMFVEHKSPNQFVKVGCGFRFLLRKKSKSFTHPTTTTRWGWHEHAARWLQIFCRTGSLCRTGFATPSEMFFPSVIVRGFENLLWVKMLQIWRPYGPLNGRGFLVLQIFCGVLFKRCFIISCSLFMQLEDGDFYLQPGHNLPRLTAGYPQHDFRFVRSLIF